MKLAAAPVDRRTLLIGGGIGLGLIVGIGAWRGVRLGPDDGEREWRLGPHVRVGKDGSVTVAVPQVETGQGIWTALPQIVADALGASWESVAVEPALLDGDFANPMAGEEGWLEGVGRLRAWRVEEAGLMRITAGSTSIRAFAAPMREAGATARAMLIAAAAGRWNVDPRECDTAEGVVLQGSRRLGFGDLAEEAAGKSPAKVKPRGKDARLIGQPLPRLDLPAKSDGRFRFAGDVRLPNMLYASARLAPPGGRLTAFSRAAAEAVPGVRAVVPAAASLAVVADTWFAAERALRAADAHFEAASDEVMLRTRFEDALASGPAERFFERGDFARTVRGSRPLTATYWVSPALHLGLEPLTATARFSGDHLEVWAATQAPEAARRRVERAADGARVTFYPLPPGEPAGRALEADAIPLAVALARATKRPVQLQLSQSASQNHDHPSGGLLARMLGLPGSEGFTAAWKMEAAGQPGFSGAIAALIGDDGPERLGRADLAASILPYAIPNVAVDATMVRTPFEAGYMRGSPQRETCFAIESFADELARAAGLEPLAYRMALLGGNPRLAHCFQTATTAAGWDGGGRGSTMGIAGASVFGSHIALVAEANLAPDQGVAVHRLIAAVDCGRIVNPQLVRQQVEAGLIWALGQATVRAPHFVAGMPQARPYSSLGLPRIARTPEVRVELVRSREASGGVSGLGPAVLAPAVANAIFAATGRRLRTLPFDAMAA